MPIESKEKMTSHNTNMIIKVEKNNVLSDSYKLTILIYGNLIILMEKRSLDNLEVSSSKKTKIDEIESIESLSDTSSLSPKIINCSEINDLHFITKNGEIVTCNKQIMSLYSDIFGAAIESSTEAIAEIAVPDYETKVVNNVVSYIMMSHQASKIGWFGISPRMYVSDEIEAQLNFGFQYSMKDFLKVLVGLCCHKDMSFCKFSPSDFIRIGEKLHIDEMVQHGISICEIGKKDEFEKLILMSRNDDTKKRLIERLFANVTFNYALSAAPSSYNKWGRS